MNEIMLAVKYDSGEPTVSARALHAALMIDTPYHKWFPRMCDYGFVESVDFNLDKNVRVQNEGKRRVSREVIDHRITINMAKELCMIQRSEIGKRCREYFLEIEKKWNSPEAVVATNGYCQRRFMYLHIYDSLICCRELPICFANRELPTVHQSFGHKNN